MPAPTLPRHRAGRSARWLGLCAGAAALALLGGCAAMSEQECRTADWREQGQRDALDGQPRSHLADLHEACAKAGVVPHDGLYLEGWSRGVRQFCTPDNGARWGRQGRSYANSCPPELDGAFSDRFRAGRRAWDAEQTLRRLQGEQRDRQRALEQAQDDASRQRLRDQLRGLDGRLRDARDDLDRAEWRLRQPY